MNRLPALSLYRPLAGARARIVAFPHAGGGASAFIKLRTALAAHQVELCPLQPPGRENRSRAPAHTDIEAMACEFATAVDSLAPLPTAFLGHSLGGLVAYLTARHLAGTPSAPAQLVVSGSLAPDLRTAPDPQTPCRSDRERVLALGGIPDAILADPDLLDMFTALIIADIRMGEAYRHRPSAPLSCPIIVYSGSGDRAALPELAPAWQRFTAQRFSTRSFAGGHFFLYADPDQTADALLADLGWHAPPMAARTGDMQHVQAAWTN